jgi:hypothetical protein
MPETPISFDDVKLLESGGLGSVFRIGDRELFVGSAVPLNGTTVSVVSEVGTLVLPRWFVEKNELVGGHVAR